DRSSLPYSSAGIPFGLQQGWTDRRKTACLSRKLCRSFRQVISHVCPARIRVTRTQSHQAQSRKTVAGSFSQQVSGFARSRLHPTPALRAEGGALAAVW